MKKSKNQSRRRTEVEASGGGGRWRAGLGDEGDYSISRWVVDNGDALILTAITQ